MSGARDKDTIEFWSSVAYPELMGALADEVSRQGMRATHRYYYTSAQYRNAKGRAQRLWMRLSLYIGYPLYLIGNILLRVRRGSILVVASNTFYAPLFACWAGKIKGVKVVHLLYDTYPDALIEAGKLKPTSWIAKGVAWVTRRTLRQCAGNVFIGQRLREYAERVYGQARCAQVIPLSVSESGEKGLIERREKERLTLFYCGNLGHLHDVATLPEALQRLSPATLSKLHIRFHASGARRVEGYRLLQEVQHRHPQLQVTLGDPLDAQEWQTAMQEADIGLSTMRPGAEKVLFPSKTFSAMALGQAIVAICPQPSDLADLVLHSKGGWVVSPGEHDLLAGYLQSLVQQPQQIIESARNACAYAHQQFSLSGVSSQWIQYLKEISSR